MVKLSICIPYYNSYDFTKKLLERLTPQLTDETELIVVDDGCNETRLDEFNDKIILVHNKENKGGAYTSNCCIDMAKGKYVALIDSDDMVSKDYVSALLEAIEEHNEDLIFMNWQDMSTGAIVEHPNNYAPWKCIYKKEKMPRFVEGWIYSFDVPFQEEIDKLNLSKYYLDKVLYYYNSGNINNLTHKKANILKNKNMRYIIMADSQNTSPFEIPRQLIEINGEPLVARTVRLLKENGVSDILITAHDKRFDNLGAERYEPKNNIYNPKTLEGYWLNAYPEELLDRPVVFLNGDVYYSENAIKTIIETDTNSTMFFCAYENKDPRYIKNWDEPLGYKVVDYELFKQKIEETKRLKDEKVCWREPVVWELYRVIHNQNVNVHQMTTDYTAINDESCDIDYVEDIEKLKEALK